MPHPDPHVPSVGARQVSPAVIAAVIGGALAAALFAALPVRDGVSPAEPITVLVGGAGWVGLWLLAALGMGWVTRRILLGAPASTAAGDTQGTLTLDAALGVALLLALDNALGRTGLLFVGQASGAAWGAWAVLAPGMLLAIPRLAEVIRVARARRGPAPVIAWGAAPAVAILLLAACSAPGWLWATEFGGYDALSYHLALPKEWLGAGRISGLAHNVYSFMPSYVEGAYAHLAALTGDGIEVACTAQLLHAALAVLAAAATARAAQRAVGRRAGPIAFVLVLGTPWVIVTGSLAYVEMPIILFLAAGLQLALPDRRDGDDGDPHGARWAGRAAAIGVLAGAAIGAKLTAALLVALPLGLLLLAARTAPARAWTRAAAGAVAAAVALLVLAPALVANHRSAGNALFPFLTSTLGPGHWTEEQAETWWRGHAPDLGVGGRLGEGWNQLLRYGVGPNPAAEGAREPWRPQWSLLPWLALIGAGVWLSGGRERGTAVRLVVVLGVQTLAWLAIGHVKSRFALPLVVPGALLAAGGIETAVRRLAPQAAGAHTPAGALPFVLSLLWCAVPVVLFTSERDGHPTLAVGAVSELTGDAHAAALRDPNLTTGERARLNATAPMTYWLNHRVPAEARIATAGDATPFYVRHPGLEYTTTWDHGVLSEALRATNGGDLIAALRARGITHLLINPTMLGVWEAAGWNDPLLTRNAVMEAVSARSTLLHVDQSGALLYEL